MGTAGEMVPKNGHGKVNSHCVAGHNLAPRDVWWRVWNYSTVKLPSAPLRNTKRFHNVFQRV